MMPYKVAPLKGSLMIVSLLGIIVSLFVIYPMSETQDIHFQSEAWGAAFAIVFFVIFVASVISMTYGPTTNELLIEEGRKKIAAAQEPKKPSKKKVSRPKTAKRTRKR